MTSYLVMQAFALMQHPLVRLMPGKDHGGSRALLSRMMFLRGARMHLAGAGGAKWSRAARKNCVPKVAHFRRHPSRARIGRQSPVSKPQEGLAAPPVPTKNTQKETKPE